MACCPSKPAPYCLCVDPCIAVPASCPCSRASDAVVFESALLSQCRPHAGAPGSLSALTTPWNCMLWAVQVGRHPNLLPSRGVLYGCHTMVLLHVGPVASQLLHCILAALLTSLGLCIAVFPQVPSILPGPSYCSASHTARHHGLSPSQGLSTPPLPSLCGRRCSASLMPVHQGLGPSHLSIDPRITVPASYQCTRVSLSAVIHTAFQLLQHQRGTAGCHLVARLLCPHTARAHGGCSQPMCDPKGCATVLGL